VTPDEDEEWPPPAARYRAALWRAEAHFERREWFAAARALAEAARVAPPEERELVRGLVHLAAAGYKRAAGDPARADRQLAHARRRLAPYLPKHRDLDLAALLTRA
jgi:hypothetical protein